MNYLYIIASKHGEEILFTNKFSYIILITCSMHINEHSFLAGLAKFIMIVELHKPFFAFSDSLSLLTSEEK